jgi:hypothetical protein
MLAADGRLWKRAANFTCKSDAEATVRRIGLVSLRALDLPSGLWQGRPIRSQLCIGLNVWLSDPQTTPMLS